MTTTSGGARCKFCWRPADYRPQPGEGFHNEGCPEGVLRLGNEKQQWEAGYSRGFNCDDEEYGRIKPWNYRFYPKSYILGYRVGEEEIDDLVDQVAQSRCFG